MEFLTRLFDTPGFLARWDSGDWPAGHAWLHVLSDLGVGSAYVAIACVLGYFLLRRKDLPFREAFLLFAVFLLVGGATHLMEALTSWWPAYRPAGVVEVFAAVVSWATVLALVWVGPRVLARRGPDELQREVEARRKAEAALKCANDELERRIDERTAELARANTALQLGHERFRITLASIGDAVISTDTAGRVTFQNPVAQALTGFRDEALGREVSEVFRIVNEETGEVVESPVAKALREGKVVGLANHTLLVAKDGTRRPIDDSASPIWDRQGFVVGCVLTFRDITERRRLEKVNADRSAASRLLASTVEFSDDAIVSKSLEGIIQSWNAAAQRLFGYSAEQVVGRSITLLIPADRRDEEERILARIRAGERVDPYDTVRVRSDGRLIDISLTVSPIRDEEGRVVGASKIARDITQRKQIEAALRTGEERFRLLGETIPSVVWTAATDGIITYVNRRWLEVCGLTAEVNARQWPELVLHTDDYEHCTRQWGQALRDGTEYEVEIRNRRHDGVYRWFVTRALPLKDASGAVESWFGVTTDIDDQKRAQQELREADRRKDEFVATLAHELRGPLAPVRNSLEVMKRARSDPALLEEAGGTMERQLNHMVRLIDDLLDISRISQGKLQLQTEPVELATVVAQAVETVRPHVESAGHELRTCLPSEPVYLMADSVRLAQVFSNLLH